MTGPVLPGLPPAADRDAAWDALPRPSGDAAPMLSVDGFEGPLDWLLEQVRAHRVDLAALSILALVDGVLAAFDTALAGTTPTSSTLAAWSTWLVMAADLALLRSRLLLPDPVARRAAADQAKVLHAQLLARTETAAAADRLERRTQLGRYVFPRGASDLVLPRSGHAGDVIALLRACLVVLQVPADTAARFQLSARPFWTQAEATERIAAMLPGLKAHEGGLGVFLPEVGGPVAAEPKLHFSRARPPRLTQC